MAHARPPTTNRGRLIRVCVGVSVALSTFSVGAALVALRFESAPVTAFGLIALGALVGVGLPVALLMA